MLIFFDSFNKLKTDPDFSVSIVNCIILGYAVCLLIIGINEIREKETNLIFLALIGICSMVLAVFLVSLTIGSLKSGFAIWLFFIFVWMVIVGLKDILGNQFYTRE
ncbi:hypothetical protein [Flavobacterium piscis]|uniref:Uncharacterized membrane protein YciS (DUF1049 family) n=1 Tax=Flavobacterium piscis TaxID=1114874 RepID=A0ABU1Y3Q2_9FLAO|nr:hypothetical protein [Flavobacterium piscis]MDR7208857.1 uncharacterized membrane protein YciS (DUF1049 family) [Flavobacterium piscis]